LGVLPWVYITLRQCYAANRPWFDHHQHRRVLSDRQKHSVIAGMALASLLLWYAPAPFFVAGTFFVYSLYVTSLFFKLYLLTIGRTAQRDGQRQAEMALLADEQLPLYTVLIPIFKEEAVVSQLMTALAALDYPKDKLEILLLTEEGDKATHAALAACSLPTPLTRVVVLPPMQPQTKPKACNVGLNIAQGELVALFDAEDIPHAQQLRLAATQFSQLPDKIVCLQSSLHIQPRHGNPLSQWFALEYLQWFGFMLPALQQLGGPIPLGGTSNHFRIGILRELEGWDPYNVTEDAELGLRLARCGFSTHMLDSYTLEEAPPTLLCWIKQRSRWIKGYMQTYCRHANARELSIQGRIVVQLFLGVQTLQYFLSPLCLVVAIGWKINVGEGAWSFASIVMHTVLLCTFLLHMYSLWIVWQGSLLNKISKLTLFFYPFYFYLHSIAAWRALYQLFVRPHYWEKTLHVGIKRP